MRELARSDEQPAFRGDQLFKWVCKGTDYEEMSNLPKAWLQNLATQYAARALAIERTLVSAKDGTRKYLYRLTDENVVEGVLMKYKYGNTICVSTQVGCRMNCAFCASGLDGLVRNLSSGEILGQVIAVNRDLTDIGERGVTNIVLMGSGEPLDNYQEVTKFLRAVNDPEGLNLSKRNVSLSTCGLCDRIRQLADEGYSPTLTVSLHAPNDGLRREIMPIAKRYGVNEVVTAARYYFDRTGRRVIFEYSMIDGLSDTDACAEQLASLLKGLACHVNLIGLNYVKERNLIGSGRNSIERFRTILTGRGISCTIRRSMGSDIEGACGQLRRAHIAREKD